MSTAAKFILVHGAWHGSWCWERVQHRLEQAGHSGLAADLSYVRAKNQTGDVDLSTHVSELVEFVEGNAESDIVLCGHSYGGMVISEAACRLQDKIKHLVYLDALLPAPGQSAVDMMSPDMRVAFYEMVTERGGGHLIPPRSAAALGVHDPQDAAWVDAKCAPFPLACFEEPAGLDGGLPNCPKTYLLARDNCPSVFEQTYKRLANQAGWTRAILPTGHDAMITAPDAVAEYLLALA